MNAGIGGKHFILVAQEGADDVEISLLSRCLRLHFDLGLVFLGQNAPQIPSRCLIQVSPFIERAWLRAPR